MIPISTQFYPFVLTSYRAPSNTEADYREVFERTTDIARKAIDDRTFHVTVSCGASRVTAAERQIIAKLIADIPQKYLDRVPAAYVIVPSAVARGVMTALRWLSPKLVMVESVASPDAALRAGEAVLRSHGVVVDRSLIDGARKWLEAEMLAGAHSDQPGAC